MCVLRIYHGFHGLMDHDFKRALDPRAEVEPLDPFLVLADLPQALRQFPRPGPSVVVAVPQEDLRIVAGRPVRDAEPHARFDIEGEVRIEHPRLFLVEMWRAAGRPATIRRSSCGTATTTDG